MSQLNSYMKTRSLDKNRVWVIYSWSREVDAIAKAKSDGFNASTHMDQRIPRYLAPKFSLCFCDVILEESNA